MRRSQCLLLVTCTLTLLFSTACVKCVNVASLTTTPPVPQITVGNVVVTQATLPNGSPSDTLEVADQFPGGGGDGVNEIWIGWSQTDTGPAEFASIQFPSGSFGSGPRKVLLTAGHYNSCSLKALDSANATIATVNHTAGQNTSQTLTLTGGNIARIDVMGAEISVQKICYKK